MLTIHNPLLTQEEKIWLSLVLTPVSQYLDVILTQVESASFVREYHENHLFLDFVYSKEVPLLPPVDTLAIIMDVFHVDQSVHSIRKVFYSRDNMDRMDDISRNTNTQPEPCPTAFHLYAYDGYVQELEIFNMDGSVLNWQEMVRGRKDYYLSHGLA